MYPNECSPSNRTTLFLLHTQNSHNCKNTFDRIVKLNLEVHSIRIEYLNEDLIMSTMCLWGLNKINCRSCKNIHVLLLTKFNSALVPTVQIFIRKTSHLCHPEMSKCYQ